MSTPDYGINTPTEPGYFWNRPLLSTGKPNPKAKWRIWRVKRTGLGLETKGLQVYWHEVEWVGPITHPGELIDEPFWYCHYCDAEIDGSCVTSGERHDLCQGDAEWVALKSRADQLGEYAERSESERVERHLIDCEQTDKWVERFGYAVYDANNVDNEIVAIAMDGYEVTKVLRVCQSAEVAGVHE